MQWLELTRTALFSKTAPVIDALEPSKHTAPVHIAWVQRCGYSLDVRACMMKCAVVPPLGLVPIACITPCIQCGMTLGHVRGAQ